VMATVRAKATPKTVLRAKTRSKPKAKPKMIPETPMTKKTKKMPRTAMIMKKTTITK
jgi:hypothetical protein